MSLGQMVLMIARTGDAWMKDGDVTGIGFKRIIMMTQMIMLGVLYQTGWRNEHPRI